MELACAIDGWLVQLEEIGILLCDGNGISHGVYVFGAVTFCVLLVAVISLHLDPRACDVEEKLRGVLGGAGTLLIDILPLVSRTKEDKPVIMAGIPCR